MKKILEFTDRIEKTAKRKEQLSKLSSGGVDDELDALYLEAIEAKLGLLEDYWSSLFLFGNWDMMDIWWWMIRERWSAAGCELPPLFALLWPGLKRPYPIIRGPYWQILAVPCRSPYRQLGCYWLSIGVLLQPCDSCWSCYRFPWWCLPVGVSFPAVLVAGMLVTDCGNSIVRSLHWNCSRNHCCHSNACPALSEELCFIRELHYRLVSFAEGWQRRYLYLLGMMIRGRRWKVGGGCYSCSG